MTIRKIKDINNVEHDIYAARATADENGNNIGNTYAAKTALTSHVDNKSNPHGVTATQVGAYTKTDADYLLSKKMNDFSLELYNGTGGNPKPVRFASFNYSTCHSEEGIAAKISMVSGHGNGSSYTFLEDAIIKVNHLGQVEVDNFKYYGQDCGAYDGANRQYGDIFWLIDETNKIVDFYVLMGQYARLNQTPWKRLTYSSKGTVTQHTSCTVYSSGTKNWANNSEIAVKSDIVAGVNTTYSLSKSGSTITLTGSDGSKTSVTDADTNTDTAVTAVGNHYTPTKSKTISASSTTSASWGSTDMVTGIEVDAAGHVTGVTSIQMPSNPNTDNNTSHSHSAGVGLTGSGNAGTSGGTYTYKAKLRSETALTVDSSAATTTSGRVYPVAVDKSGYLAVNVPWTNTDTDTNTTYSFATGDSNGQFKVTPSSGSAYNVSIKGLGSAAYANTSAFQPAGSYQPAGNYMDLGSTQTASGVKTFSNGIKIGSATLTYSSNALTITF